jgi:hypothetical protein
VRRLEADDHSWRRRCTLFMRCIQNKAMPMAKNIVCLVSIGYTSSGTRPHPFLATDDSSTYEVRRFLIKQIGSLTLGFRGILDLS